MHTCHTPHVHTPHHAPLHACTHATTCMCTPHTPLHTCTCHSHHYIYAYHCMYAHNLHPLHTCTSHTCDCTLYAPYTWLHVCTYQTRLHVCTRHTHRWVCVPSTRLLSCTLYSYHYTNAHMPRQSTLHSAHTALHTCAPYPTYAHLHLFRILMTVCDSDSSDSGCLPQWSLPAHGCTRLRLSGWLGLLGRAPAFSEGSCTVQLNDSTPAAVTAAASTACCAASLSL